jgi:hypothetical protein
MRNAELIVGRDRPAFAEAASRRQAITPFLGAFGERTLHFPVGKF